jgi:hypothetical protein
LLLQQLYKLLYTTNWISKKKKKFLKFRHWKKKKKVAGHFEIMRGNDTHTGEGPIQHFTWCSIYHHLIFFVTPNRLSYLLFYGKIPPGIQGGEKKDVMDASRIRWKKIKNIFSTGNSSCLSPP